MCFRVNIHLQKAKGQTPEGASKWQDYTTPENKQRKPATGKANSPPGTQKRQSAKQSRVL